MDTSTSDDVALVRGLLAGDHDALRKFRVLAVGPLARALVMVPPTSRATFVEDTIAELVAPRAGSPPALATYSGRASLVAWLRAVGCRRACRLTRDTMREESRHSEFAKLVDDVCNPTEGILDAGMRAAFGRCFAEALTELTAEERVMLKQHVLDGLASHELAPLYGCHRATVSRRLHRVRAQVRDVTIEKFARLSGLDPDDADNLIGQLMSHLELSLSRIFAATDGSASD